MTFINEINDILWTYILIIMLLGCAVWFSIRTRFVQFRMIREMIVLLSESAGKGKQGEKHVSSFQAFAISIASRVGTGNLAGVATAIAIGGPGAIFWMWVIALLGASSAFIESTLGQLYKIRGKDSFIGGPAYYMKKGLKQPWMGMLFAILISITFGFAFNSVQSNTICAAAEHAFGVNHIILGGVLTLLTLVIIFGGIQRIARVSSIFAGYGIGICGAGVGDCYTQYHSFTGRHRSDCQSCFWLGTGTGRRSRHGIDARYQERALQQ